MWDSLHRHLQPESAVSLGIEASSIESANNFYAQVGNESLLPFINAFNEMEPKMTEYGARQLAANERNQTNR